MIRGATGEKLIQTPAACCVGSGGGGQQPQWIGSRRGAVMESHVAESRLIQIIGDERDPGFCRQFVEGENGFGREQPVRHGNTYRAAGP